MVPEEGEGQEDWSRQLRKGLLDLAILVRLKAGPVHGYALIASLKEGRLMPKEGAEATVYQALQRLARKGWAEASWSDPAANERPRKMYAITRRGRSECARMAAEWRALDRALAEFEGENT
jgi:PadR family transcriptional regulator, regulatory protein PadR